MVTGCKNKLPEVLWAYQTAHKTLVGMSPYQLVYDKTCHLPFELEFKAHWVIKGWNMDLELARQNMKMQISELEEWQEKAYHSTKLYKERTKRWHDKRIKKKEFHLRDKVLLFNSRVQLFGYGKLQSKWDGPFKVVASSPHGAITLESDDGQLFTVNAQRLKIFYKPEIQELKEFNVIEFINF